MGDRYELSVKCRKCGYQDDEAWYAPTCGVMSWKCPKCGLIIDLEEYSGINAEGCANTVEGVEAVRKLKLEIRKQIIKQKIKKIDKLRKRKAKFKKHETKNTI